MTKYRDDEERQIANVLMTDPLIVTKHTYPQR